MGSEILEKAASDSAAMIGMLSVEQSEFIIDEQSSQCLSNGDQIFLFRQQQRH